MSLPLVEGKARSGKLTASEMTYTVSGGALNSTQYNDRKNRVGRKNSSEMKGLPMVALKNFLQVTIFMNARQHMLFLCCRPILHAAAHI